MRNIFFQKKCRKNLPQIKKRVYLHSQNGITPWSTCFSTAEIAQLVEHNLAKVGVASSSLVFRSKSNGWLNANHFYFLQTDSHERLQVAPFQGVRGYQQKFARNAARSAGSSLVVRSTHSDNRKIIAFFVRFAEVSATI